MLDKCSVLFSLLLLGVITVSGSGFGGFSKSDIACQQMKQRPCKSYVISFLQCKHHEDYQPWNTTVVHGNKCKKNEDCQNLDSICFAGICLCNLGVYYSQSRNTCVRECEVYGDEMDVYPGVALKGHNDGFKMGVSTASCYKRCVNEKRFLCRTVEVKPINRICQLSGHGYLDVTVEERQNGLPQWSFAQRQCK